MLRFQYGLSGHRQVVPFLPQRARRPRLGNDRPASRAPTRAAPLNSPRTQVRASFGGVRRMNNNRALRRAIRHALCMGAIATAGAHAPSAMAQDDPTQQELEEITVTGTRIARQDYQSASPISTVDAELFEQTGAPTIETVLNTLPQFVPAITTTS